MNVSGESLGGNSFRERNEVMTKLSIFGDSILKGVMFNGNGPKRYSLYEGSLCERLRSEGIEAENRSRMGYTVIDGAKDIDEYIANAKPGSILLEYGGNDSMYRWKEISESPSKVHGRVIDIKNFTETYASIIKKLLANGFDVTLTTIIPIDPERYINHVSGKLSYENIMKWLGNPDRLTRMHDQYNEAIIKLANKYGCGLIDLRSAFENQAGESQLLCVDGIHPTLLGHKKIEQAVADFFSSKAALPV
ncbi:MAG: SGNH/GDSL hydrolase family protein [Clostridia bacterium]|nr:SGNH/GDSL hydrolase family protein [Clostridia bacterium]